MPNVEIDMEPITNEEMELIKQLREDVSDLNLKGYYDSDIFYMRWLRARDLQPERAEEMLRKSMEWRKQNDIDMIHKWEPESASVPVDYCLEICGYNKYGDPVALIPFAYWDIRKGVEAGMANEMIRYIDQVLENVETLIRNISTPERPVTQLDIIFDMNNLSFWQLASMKTIETLLEVVRRYEANHPEILHRAYVINASRIFNMLFNIVKPFLSPRTLAKVMVFPAQPSQWIPVLLESIDVSQLPKYFGGTARTSLKMYREDVVIKRYLRTSFTEEDQDNLTTININPEEKVLLTFDVNVANSKLRWQFRTDYYDLEFSVYREGNANDPEVPYDRVPSFMVKIEGEIICKTPGQYVAEFNNAYSEIRRTKTLHYNFQVIEPETPKK